MTIWIYGDSYASADFDLRFDIINPHLGWYAQLNDDYHNFGKPGSSLAYTYHMFRKSRDMIKENDIVIITITSLERRWLFPDKPHQGVLTEFDRAFKKDYPPEVIQAVKYYITHLNDNTDLEITYLLDFLYNLHGLTKELNLHTIILPVLFDENNFLLDCQKNFPYFHFSKGYLFEVTLRQYDLNFFNSVIQNMIFDGMKNHLLKTNHSILANKLLENIQYKKEIDLTEGFLYGTINYNMISNPKIIQEEFLCYPDYCH